MANKPIPDYMTLDSDDEDFELARQVWLQQRQAKKAREEQARQLQLLRQIEEARIAEKRAAEEARIAKEKAEAFACRRCPEKFGSNTKLHEHVRTKHAKKPSATAPIATPATLPTSPPTAPSATATPPTPPTSPASTPKKPFSWAEIASRPKSPSTPSRIPRPTALPTPPATPPPSPHLPPILQPFELANSITKRPSITRFAKTPCLTIEDLYDRFHGKPRPSSLSTRQIRLPSAPPPGQMRPRQMRITSYFKPAANRPTPPPPTSAKSTAQLASNRKHADLKTPVKSTWIRHLASFSGRSPHTTGHSKHHTCRRCKQHFSSGNLLHRHLTHCNRGTFSFKHAASSGL